MCTHIGGAKTASTQSAKPVTMGATANITKTAGPSPLAAARKSKLQWSHFAATVKNPS
jgi:hypothetical protein